MLTPDNSPLSSIFLLFSGASLSDQNGLAKVPFHSSVTVLDALLSPFIVAVQSLKHVWLSFETPWTAAHQASLSITNSQSWLKLMSVDSVMPTNHLILCCPLLLPSIFPSIRVFYNELALCIRGPKYWSFSISPLNEYSWLISSSIDWFDLAVQGTLRSLLQDHSSKASIL